MKLLGHYISLEKENEQERKVVIVGRLASWLVSQLVDATQIVVQSYEKLGKAIG